MMEESFVYAVISTGGKQVKVSEGDVIQVETQDVKPGDGVVFSEVLMLADGDGLKLGTPKVEAANVFGTVLDVLRSPKILVFKKKRRKQYRRTRGHRQYLMRVRIDELGLYAERRKKPEEMPAPSAAAKEKTQKAASASKVKKAAKTVKTVKTVKKAAPVAKKSSRTARPAAKGRGAKDAAKEKKPATKAKSPDSKGKKR